MENHANNPDDSEQESADKHRVMSPFPASGRLLEGEERPVAGRQDQRPGNIPHFPFILASLLGIISRNVLVILFLQWLVLFGLDEVFSSQWTKHSLEAHRALGSAPIHGSSDPPLLFHSSQELHFPRGADESTYQSSPAALAGPGMPPGMDSSPKGRLGSCLDELKVTSMSSFPNSLTLMAALYLVWVSWLWDEYAIVGRVKELQSEHPALLWFHEEKQVSYPSWALI